MTTKSKPKSIRIALRINGRPVINAAGAKLAAEWLGCTQTTGPQAGRGSVLKMVEAIGAGDVALFGADDLRNLREIADEIDALTRDNKIINVPYMPEALCATAAALRNAARLIEASEKQQGAIKMADDIKTVTVHDARANCPYCGEAYSWSTHKWQNLVASNPHNVTCDGEDGCGRDFIIIFKD